MSHHQTAIQLDINMELQYNMLPQQEMQGFLSVLIINLVIC